jgi:hypothetical protein
MEVCHDITFSKSDNVDAELNLQKISFKKTPLFQGDYIISFKISESDTRWPFVEQLVNMHNGVDTFTTLFTKNEVVNSQWLRLEPIFKQGYPQPEDTWKNTTLKGMCPKCGAGYTQIAPFRIQDEPKLGKNDFVSLFWTYALFCKNQVFTKLNNHNFAGYEEWPALLDSSNQPSKTVSQLYCHQITQPGLTEEDKLNPEKCLECGITKYEYLKKGYMRYKTNSISPGFDIQLTKEWFGSGGHSGFREYLISQRFAKLIINEGWRGVSLKPIILI